MTERFNKFILKDTLYIVAQVMLLRYLVWEVIFILLLLYLQLIFIIFIFAVCVATFYIHVLAPCKAR